jgi:hypothetical protein
MRSPTTVPDDLISGIVMAPSAFHAQLSSRRITLYDFSIEIPFLVKIDDKVFLGDEVLFVDRKAPGIGYDRSAVPA